MFTEQQPPKRKLTREDDDERRFEKAIRAAYDQNEGNEVIELLLHRYGPQISRTLLTLSQSNRELAMDAYQEFCLKLVKSWRSFEWRSSLRTWLYSIAKNTLYTMSKSAYERRRESLDDALLGVYEQTFTTGLGLSTAFDAMWDMMNDILNPEQQWLIVLHKDVGLPWSEIAQILEGKSDKATVNKLKQRHSRCIKKLREEAQKRGFRLK